MATSLEIRANLTAEYKQILTEPALAFLESIARKFGPRREELLALRVHRQRQLDAGNRPDFLPETKAIRDAEWTVAATPADLQDRRVEITGPVDRKMIINALNSGAKVFMADFEDASSPTWELMLAGQINLRDAINGSISYTSEDGKLYQLNEQVATLMVRPRGWHLVEKHILLDGKPIAAAFMDFALYFFHNAKTLLAKGTGPYFYLPKMESHLEVRLWNEIFNFAQDELGIARGSIKATILIETILAAFEIDEFLYELKDHCVGLNCGRWDYIFSYIKRLHKHAEFLLPDRSQVTMDKGFLNAYSLLVIKTCHRRNAHAIGGMAAQIPIKSDPVANETALAKVRADKQREAKNGHDGTWVAHPGLVPIALEIFDQYMPNPHQKHIMRDDVQVTATDLLRPPRIPEEGEITETGLRHNVSAALHYMAAWLDGNGCVPINNLMEDAATAEIARAQLWQWVHHNGQLNDGRKCETALVTDIINQELGKIQTSMGESYANSQYSLAAKLLAEISLQPEFAEFLTLVAYEHLH
jgi:malate synthase